MPEQTPRLDTRWPEWLDNPAVATGVVGASAVVLSAVLGAGFGVLSPELLLITALVSASLTLPLTFAVRRYHLRLNAQRQRLEEMVTKLVRQAEAHERGAAQRAQIIATVAHELKTPLGNVREFSKTIQAQADDPALVREFAGLMEQEASEVLATATDMLDMLAESRPDVEMRMERVELRAVAEHVVRANEPRAETKQQRILLHPDPTGLVVDADRHRLHVIVSNLVSNAVKYTPPGGRVDVRIAAALGESGPEGRVIVEDTGPGLSPADLEAVFTPFVHGDAPPTGGEHQTGLGLTISQRLAQRQGGRIWVERGSIGARFILAMPLAEDDA